MRVVEALNNIRSAWLSRVARQLARGEDVRETFEQTLSRFYDLVQQAVETGNPGWLDAILDEWIEARTQTEVEEKATSLPPILNRMLLLTIEIVRENLDSHEALQTTEALLPVYTYAFEYATQKETTLYVEHISRELEKAKATLERLDKSKSDFIAIAAHELKTPLTLIEGYNAMLYDQIPDKEPASQFVILLKGIDNGTHRLREIVDDMIDVSLIDNNLLSIKFQPVWLDRLLAVVENEFQDKIRGRRQTLEIRQFAGCSEMTFGDNERLCQALRNLISNAIKYTPDGGHIVVDGRKLPGFVEITVSDNGIGIAPEDHALVFEKFGRLGSVALHSSGKTKFKGGGPGLGLPITKGIIEGHGGAIWIESSGYDETRYPGTTFHILLPSRKAPPDDKNARIFAPLTNAEKDLHG